MKQLEAAAWEMSWMELEGHGAEWDVRELCRAGMGMDVRLLEQSLCVL